MADMNGDVGRQQGAKGDRILDALPGLVWTSGADGRADFFNRRWLDYTGLGLGDAMGHGWRAAIHPLDLKAFDEAWDAVRGAGGEGEIEARLRRSDGEYRWFVFRPVPFPDEVGDSEQWCWLASHADETPAEPDGRLRRFVDMLPSQVLFLGLEGQPQFWNRQVHDYFGMSTEELNRWSTNGAIHADDLPEVYEHLTRLLTTGETYDAQHRMLRQDGAYRWVQARAVPCRDAQGNVVRYVSCQIDIDDQKRAETLLAGEVRMLEMVALRRPLPEMMDALCRLTEEIAEGCLCSILLIDPGGERFHVGGAPGLPDSFNAIVDGKAIDPNHGPLSLSVALKAPVVSPDVPSDPRWATSAWPPLMNEYGLRSCWSMPVTSGAGEVMGLFVVYRREPVGPTAAERQLIDRLSKIAGIALERARADEALLVSEAELRRTLAQLAEGQRLSKTGSFTADLQLDQHSWSDEYFRIFELDPAARPSVQAVRDRVHPEDLERFDREIQRGMDGGDADFTFRVVTPQAGLKYLRGVANLIEHIDGRPIFMGTVQDITENKLAEAALRASDAELRQAYSHLTEAQRISKTGSFTWDVQADEHNWSAEIRRIFSFGLDETISIQMIQAAVHPDDMAEVERVIGGAVEGRNFDLVFRIVNAEGEVRHAHVVGNRIAHITDRPVFLGALQDVTESRLAEEALKASETDLKRSNSYLTQAQRMSRTGSGNWDLAEGSEQEWSEELHRIFELAPGEPVMLEDLLTMIHPDDAAVVQEAMGRAMATGDDFDVFYRITTRSGAVKHLHSVGERMTNVTDRIVYYGATQDVTESAQTQEALMAGEAELRQANRYLTTAQRLSKTGSFTWDLETNQALWSEEMYRIFEVGTEGPVPSALAREVVHPDDMHVIEALVPRARAGQDFDAEFRLMTPRGSVKHVHVAGNLLEDASDQPMFVGAMQDVTDRKLAEEALDRARRELDHVSRITALSALTASIAHEVNQPLAGILTNAGAGLRMLAADPPNLEGARATVQRTVRDAHRASEVIKRLRALFARKPLGSELLDLNEAAREILALSAGELQSGRVITQTDFAKDLPRIVGDRVQLQQVILNLVLNAGQAMRTIDDRPRELRVSTRTDDEGQILFAVRDRGVGASVDDLNQLFNAFYTTKPDGMGVGLSISRSIIEAHGGRISAHPNEGPGLTFTFAIPAAAQTPAAATEASHTTP
jgi:PAS domain S-box-containing protein